MNTSPDLVRSRLEKFKARQELRAWSSSSQEISEELWVEKSCAFIRGIAAVLAVARKQLAPEIEKGAFRLFLLWMLLFELLRCMTHR